MQDRPPQNRAERRAAGKRSHHKQPPAAALVRPPLPLRSQNAPQGQAISGGAPLADDDSVDYGPGGRLGPRPGETWEQADERIGAELGARKPASHKAGGSKQQRIYEALASYYALAGLAVSRWDHTDGQLIVANAEDCAQAWMIAGKSEPKIMRALELITIAGPYTALVTVHVTLLFRIMDRHGSNPFAGLFAPVAPRAPAGGTAPVSRREQPVEPAPLPSLPYVPVGPQAPTEAPSVPPPYPSEDMLVIPDEGLPADLDILLRQAARETGRPYQELRQEALVELAQIRMQQNGHSRVQAPGALGAPVARE